MSREEKLAKNTLILTIGTFLPKFAAIITLPILTGYLTKEEYGTYDLITILVSLFLPAITLQIQTAAFRFLIDVRNQKDDIKSIITNMFFFILPVSIVALFFLFIFLPGSIINRILICTYFLVDILVNAARQIARGLEKNVYYSISAIVSAFGKMLFAVIFVWWLRMGFTGAVAALCLASATSLVIIFLTSRMYKYIDISLYSLDGIKDLLSYSWPMVPNSMSMWIMRVSDRLVVTIFMGVSVNAIYAVANKIPSLLSLAQSSFTMAWQENASIVSKDDDVEEYYSSMFMMIFDLMAGFLGLLICATPLLFILLIRGDYTEAYNQMPILFLAIFFYSQSAFLGGIYVAFKATRSVGLTTMVSAACNLIIDLTTIKWIGLYAASVSTLISYLLLFLFRAIDVRKLVKIKYDIKHIVIVIVILIVESVFCYMQHPILNVINIAFGVTVFFVLNKEFMKAVWKKGIKIINGIFHWKTK